MCPRKRTTPPSSEERTITFVMSIGGGALARERASASWALALAREAEVEGPGKVGAAEVDEGFDMEVAEGAGRADVEGRGFRTTVGEVEMPGEALLFPFALSTSFGPRSSPAPGAGEPPTGLTSIPGSSAASKAAAPFCCPFFLSPLVVFARFPSFPTSSSRSLPARPFRLPPAESFSFPLPFSLAKGPASGPSRVELGPGVGGADATGWCLGRGGRGRALGIG